jgi:hypothetical protein
VLLFMMTTGSFPWNMAKRGDAGFEALLAGELDRVESWMHLTPNFTQVCILSCRLLCADILTGNEDILPRL